MTITYMMIRLTRNYIKLKVHYFKYMTMENQKYQLLTILNQNQKNIVLMHNNVTINYYK